MQTEETGGVGVVGPQTLRLEQPGGGWRLEGGGELPYVDVCWESCGLEKPENDNVVFICHALTGDAHVAGIRPGETKPSGWWEGMVGPGRAFDTNRWRVVCANVLGGCKGTTGPMSVDPRTGRPYGSAFPRFTISDTVDVYRALLRAIGVKRLAALAGGSFGGMQVIDWMTRHPEEMEAVCLIASAPSQNTQALAFNVVGRAAILDDPEFRGGDYYGVGDGKGPKKGLASARQLAHITYLSREHLQKKFGRELQRNWLDEGEARVRERLEGFGTAFQIESYLDHQAEKFLARFDANTYLHVTQAMDLFDAGARYGSLEAALARATCRTLVVSFSGDVLFAEWQSRDVARGLIAARKRVSYCHLEIGVGHDAFLTHIADLSKLVGGFLGSPAPEIREWQARKYAAIVDMVPQGAKVLDIGCGKGTLLNLLRAKKGVTGAGVEIDVADFEAALADGNDVIFENADEKLGLVPDGFYDLAVVSETLQVVKNPRQLLREALRVADEAIVSFPNFAAYRIRLTLGLKGRLPVSKQLPFEWYDTPNVHCVTLKDFRALCDKEGYEIREVKAESRHLIGKILLFLGFRNLGASKIVARIAKRR